MPRERHRDRGQVPHGLDRAADAEQLAFVGLLVKQRGNLQKVAADLDVSYNTARNRMDEIVEALEDVPVRKVSVNRMAVLERLAYGELSFEEAMYLLRS